MASPKNAKPIRRTARRSRTESVWPVSSPITTIEAKISMNESRANPANATDRAATAATTRNPISTTFQPRVAYSSRNPRCVRRRCRSVDITAGRSRTNRSVAATQLRTDRRASSCKGSIRYQTHRPRFSLLTSPASKRIFM